MKVYKVAVHRPWGESRAHWFTSRRKALDFAAQVTLPATSACETSRIFAQIETINVKQTKRGIALLVQAMQKP